MRGAEALLDCSAPSTVFLFQANYLQYPPNKQLNNTRNGDWIASSPAPRKDGTFFVVANNVKQFSDKTYLVSMSGRIVLLGPGIRQDDGCDGKDCVHEKTYRGTGSWPLAYYMPGQASPGRRMRRRRTTDAIEKYEGISSR